MKIPPVRHVLRTRLLDPHGPLYLRAELDGTGRPVAGTEAPQISSEALWWPPVKLFGRHLTPWMADQSPVPA